MEILSLKLSIMSFVLMKTFCGRNVLYRTNKVLQNLLLCKDYSKCVFLIYFEVLMKMC